jgi:hypothetical protein
VSIVTHMRTTSTTTTTTNAASTPPPPPPPPTSLPRLPPLPTSTATTIIASFCERRIVAWIVACEQTPHNAVPRHRIADVMFIAALSNLLRCCPADRVCVFLAPSCNKVVLRAGTYHIGTSLRLGCGKRPAGECGYLMGEGPDKTFIFALDPSMDMVTGDASVYDSARMHIAGVTLAGGTHGIRLADATMSNHSHPGRVAVQMTESTISHLYFANFSGTAVRLCPRHDSRPRPSLVLAIGTRKLHCSAHALCVVTAAVEV